MPPHLQQILDLIRDRWDHHNQPTTQRQIMAATGLSQSLVSRYLMELRGRYDQIGCTGRTVNSTVYYFPIDDLRPEDITDRRSRLIHRLKPPNVHSAGTIETARMLQLLPPPPKRKLQILPLPPNVPFGGTKGGSASDDTSTVAQKSAVASHGRARSDAVTEAPHYTPSTGDFVQWGTYRYQIRNLLSATDEAVLVITQEGTFRISDRAAVPHPELPHLRIFSPDRKLTA